MRRRGRPVLGGVAGFLLGVFLGFDLWLLGVVGSDSATLTVLPFLGLALGLAAAYWAPLRRRRASDEVEAAQPQ